MEAEDETVPQSMLGTELSLNWLSLVVEDGEEEPLVLPAGTGCHPETAHVPIRNRIALPPDAQWVDVRAFTHSRHATVSICRWNETSPSLVRQAADLMSRTVREKPIPPASPSQVSGAVRMQAAWRGHLTRREERISGQHAVEPSVRKIATSMLEVAELARAAKLRWNRATTQHRSEARGKTAPSNGKAGHKKGKDGHEARLGILLVDRQEGQQTARDPMDKVTAGFKTFLRSNWIAIHAELSRHDFNAHGGERLGVCDKATFEKVLHELGLPKSPEHTSDFPKFYIATGLHPSIPDAKMKYDELPMFLIAMQWERERDHTCRLSLVGATKYAPVVSSNPKKGAKGGKGKATGKAQSPTSSSSLGHLSLSAAAQETVASFRISVMGADFTCCTYQLDVLIAPTGRPYIPPMPPSVTSLLSRIMPFFGDLIPNHLVHELPRGSCDSELTLQQKRSIESGTVKAGENAVDVDRFVSCCVNLGIATSAIARLSFEGISRERPGAMLGAQSTWKAIFICFVRQASAQPLVRLAPYQLDYVPEEVLACIAPFCELINYNLSAASSFSSSKSLVQGSRTRSRITEASKKSLSVSAPADDRCTCDRAQDSCNVEINNPTSGDNNDTTEVVSSTPRQAEAETQDTSNHDQTTPSETKEDARQPWSPSYTRSAPLHASGIYPITASSKAMQRAASGTALDRRRLFRPNSPNPALAAPGVAKSATPTTSPRSDAALLIPHLRAPPAPPGAAVLSSSSATKSIEQLLQEEQDWALKHFSRATNQNAGAKVHRRPPSIPRAPTFAVGSTAIGNSGQQELLLQAWQIHLGSCWRAGIGVGKQSPRKSLDGSVTTPLYRAATPLRHMRRATSTSNILREHAQQSLTLPHAVTATAQPIFAPEGAIYTRSSRKHQ